MYLLLCPSIAQLLGNLVPFKSFHLLGPRDNRKVILDHFLARIDISLTTFSAHSHNLLHLLIQLHLHIHVLLLGLHFLINGSWWCLNSPNRSWIRNSVIFLLSLFFLKTLIDLLLPELALSLLCFLFLSNFALFLLIELLDLIVEHVTLFDKIINSSSQLTCKHLLLVWLLFLPDRIGSNQFECVKSWLVDTRA